MPTTLGTMRVPGEGARDRENGSVGERASQDREVAVQRALGLDDEPGLDAALLGEQRRVHVRHVLADDVREDALQRREAVHADVVRGELTAHLDVEARDRSVREAREELAQLLDEGDARADERIDDPAGDVHGIRYQVALERELDRPRDRHAGLLLRLIGARPEVRSDDHVGQLEQAERRRIRLRRLGREHVEPRTGDHAAR